MQVSKITCDESETDKWYQMLDNLDQSWENVMETRNLNLSHRREVIGSLRLYDTLSVGGEAAEPHLNP